MPDREESRVQNGARIEAGTVRDAVTRAPFVYADGATQVFTEDGRTTFIEKGRSSTGEWGVDDDGRFWSFWPPSYRAVYDVTWIANSEGEAVGVSFADVNNADGFDGRYRVEVVPT